MADRRAATRRRTRGKTRRKPAGAGRAPDLAARDFGDLLRRATAPAVRYWRRLPEMRAFTRPPDDLVRALEEDEA